ncbi:hypothetical protein SARC_03340 [Sphaeroforma arctica JP610]|uniref:Uncharacterized protein n=1 Tax=Sphaeroforma arctica JP610 TaxID=667725 RepID=A0A0L0G5Z1_9EUKA|nr:hypothetical protein SARC_03340 [Sphaeroforma arctica JP610]KNC84445.1 hypothetical protein SARC_03340 [Sphaeroforma arctica JP610]|eukprot:XP_014158347.1 hypothetical protein SARC_03340 [Sphaeroforma arctica JP610]
MYDQVYETERFRVDAQLLAQFLHVLNNTAGDTDSFDPDTDNETGVADVKFDEKEVSALLQKMRRSKPDGGITEIVNDSDTARDEVIRLAKQALQKNSTRYDSKVAAPMTHIF